MLKREHVIGSTKVCHSTGLCGVIELLDWPQFRIIWSNGETGHYRLCDCPLENIQRIEEDSSRDVRDDAEFRARIARLADAGLTLDCTPKPYTPPFYGKGLTILITPPMPAWTSHVPFSGFARHMTIDGITYFQHVLWVYESTDEAAWRLDRDDAATAMIADDLWNQSDSIPCWQRNIVPEFSEYDKTILHILGVKV